MNSTHPTVRHRRHPTEFKRQLVALCQPGVSTSAVALAHGVNTNLLRRWIKQYAGELPSQAIAPSKLVAVQVDLPVETPMDDVIEISIQKNTTRINIRWPGTQAHACGQWLGEWIK
ncbi:MAG: transposase [Sideroxydans sp.]|nr:transposase [Sideroxydans sp.]